MNPQNLHPPRRQPRVPFTAIASYGNQHQLAERLGVSLRTVARWAAGGIPDDRCDEIAVKLGRHPCELWPDWFGA